VAVTLTKPKPAEEVIDAHYNRNSLDGERYKQIPSIYLLGGGRNSYHHYCVSQGANSRVVDRLKQAVERLVESPRTGG